MSERQPGQLDRAIGIGGAMFMGHGRPTVWIAAGSVLVGAVVWYLIARRLSAANQQSAEGDGEGEDES